MIKGSVKNFMTLSAARPIEILLFKISILSGGLLLHNPDEIRINSQPNIQNYLIK